MKLFKSLLVAPATLGLLAPMSATANEVTISDFAPAEQLAVTNSRVDGLEARLNNIEAGSFSETTTASFAANFAIGAVNGGTETTNDAVNAGYDFQIDLNTSFTVKIHSTYLLTLVLLTQQVTKNSILTMHLQL